MRLHALALAGLIAVGQSLATAQPSVAAQVTHTQPVQALTLDEAWRLAVAANPALRGKHAQLIAAEGARADAGAALYNNPQLTLENTRRSAPPDGQVKFPHPWPPQIPPGRTGQIMTTRG